ncbi:MAG: TSUP family transporter [Bacillota bacterium]|uniref:sulfite exporter TauE/SafE family protein n=1 Tax=Desulfurispora thermophila TaxID=265470 RepID=UPI00036840C8|nr:sulfite exporter TauE/SafE family protein [Desulfurispora thermophila]
MLGLFALCFLLGTLAVLTGVDVSLFFVAVAAAVLPEAIADIRTASLIISLLTGLIAGAGMLRAGLVQPERFFPAIVIVPVTALLGAVVGYFMPLRFLSLLFGLLILLLVFSRKFQVGKKAAPFFNVGGRWPGLALAAFAGGFLGVGGFAIALPWLSGLLDGIFKSVLGTGKFIFLWGDAAASLVYIQKTVMPPLVTATVVLGVVAGTWFAARFLLFRINAVAHVFRRAGDMVLVGAALICIGRAMGDLMGGWF